MSRIQSLFLKLRGASFAISTATNTSTTIYVLARSWRATAHPAVIKAVEGRLHKGTVYGMPHNMEWELAEEICTRFPVEMCRFGNSGTEATMHAIRLARAATGRDKIIKFEGGYHGLHDAALVSVKPHPPADDFGDIKNPKPVSGGAGVPKASIANVLVATFNDLETVERRFGKIRMRLRRSFSSRS